MDSIWKDSCCYIYERLMMMVSRFEGWGSSCNYPINRCRDNIDNCQSDYHLYLTPSIIVNPNFSLSTSRNIRTFMASSSASRWFRPEAYPLFAAVGTAIGICGFQLIRNMCINPEVRVNKQGRAAGVLENFAEGEKYAEHGLRKFVRNRRPEIMPSINSFFSDPQKN